MATAYTNLLGFALPVTGELAGTWGDTVNNSITELVEDSIAGTATASVASGDWTLSTTGSGQVNEARCAIIRPTGTPGVSRNVIAPSSSKAYIVDNQSDAAVVFKGAATTGVTIAAGKQALVAWNGSVFVQVGASAGGSNTQVQYNSNGSLAGSANLTFNGTILTANGFSGPLNGTVGATTPTTGVFTDVTLNAQGDVRFADSDSSNWVAFQGPATIASNVTWTLPSADGSSGQFLSTNGSGTLSWATASGGGGGGGTSVTVTQATATASQTTFNVTYTVGQLSVYLNGALLASADYTATNGTTVVLATGAAANDIFTAVAYNSATKIEAGDSKVEVTDTGSNGTIVFNTDGTERGRFTAGGYFKQSNTGSYISSTGAYNEFNSDGTGDNTLIRSTSSSLTGAVLEVNANRNTTNNTFYPFSYYNNAAGAYRFRVADSGAIATAGSITLGSVTAATSGIGVQFPATQSASSDANTLDDYEEGTWTPSLGGNTTYSGRSGTYTKIGNVVTAWFYVEVNVLGTGSNSTFSGLPFSLSASSGGGGEGAYGATVYQANLAISPVSLGPIIVSSTSIRFDGRTAAAATASNTLAIFGNGAAVYGGITYRTT